MKISAPTSSEPQSTETSTEGVPLPEACGRTKYYPNVTLDKAIKAIESYAPALTDTFNWLAMLNLIYSGWYFENPNGWLLVTTYRAGLNVVIHGASFNGRMDEEDCKEFKALLDHIIKEFRILSIVAYVAASNEPSRLFVKRMGFEVVGVLPNDDTISGKPMDRLIFNYTSKEA